MNRMTLPFLVCLLLGALASGCRGPGFNLPPAARLAAPGPGVDGPGPGVLSPEEMMMRQVGSMNGPPDDGVSLASCRPHARRHCGGAAAGGGCGCFGGDSACGPIESGIVGGIPSVQVLFAQPEGMRVMWDESGTGTFANEPLVTPARTNFQTAGLYRLKITHIPAHEGLELYPTVEIAPPTPRSHAFLAHNTVPVQWTVDDLNQIASGNFVTKVIYLPDPKFQHLAVAGVETLVSTRLDPGLDPIVEADRRGSILAIVRTGNKDIEMPGMEGEACIGYSTFAAAGCDGPMPQGGTFGSGVGLAGYVTGVNSPSYGYPITGTPIGLPGPPHIPLGGPAGLKKHVVHNWTHTYIPQPSHTIDINVKQSPGISYPEPRTQAWIHQYNHPNCGHFISSE